MTRWSLVLVVVLALPASVLAADVSVDTVKAKGIRGALTTIDGKGTIVVKTEADGEKKLSAADVVRLRLTKGEAKPVAKDVEVILHNGDRLFGTVAGAAAEGQEIVFRERSVGLLRIDMGLVRWIRFSGGRLIRLAPGEGTAKDYVFHKNGDRISGSVDSFSNKGVTMERAGEMTTLAFGDLNGIYIAPLDAVKPMEGIYAVLRLKDGGRLSARVQGFKDGIFTLRLVDGMARQGAGAKTNPDVAREEVLELSFRNGSFLFLSDRTPELIREEPWFDKPQTFKPPFGPTGPLGYRKDRSYDGNPLRLAGRRFFKGIGSHSWCRIQYRLDGGFLRLHALVGVDDEVLTRAEKGSVIFRVFVDGKETWTSPVLKGGMKPVPVSVDLTGGKVLSLVVDYAGDIVEWEDDHVNDHGDWADALLVKKKS